MVCNEHALRSPIEKRCFHKLGRVVWILLSVSLVRDEGGEPLYFVSQIEDITERSTRAKPEQRWRRGAPWQVSSERNPR